MSPATGAAYLHPQLGPLRYNVVDLGNDPDRQVATTIGRMRVRAKEAAKDPWFRDRARRMLLDRPGAGRDGYGFRDSLGGVLESAWLHAKGSIRFQEDEVTGRGVGGIEDGEVIETLIHPVDMAKLVDQGRAVGDCDCFSAYVGALLLALGVKDCAFVTVAADDAAPDQYSHVYLVCYVNGRRVAIDASHGKWFGWEAPNKFGKRTEWKLDTSLADFANVIVISSGLVYLWRLYNGRVGR